MTTHMPAEELLNALSKEVKHLKEVKEKAQALLYFLDEVDGFRTVMAATTPAEATTLRLKRLALSSAIHRTK